MPQYQRSKTFDLIGLLDMRASANNHSMTNLETICAGHIKLFRPSFVRRQEDSFLWFNLPPLFFFLCRFFLPPLFFGLFFCALSLLLFAATFLFFLCCFFLPPLLFGLFFGTLSFLLLAATFLFFFCFFFFLTPLLFGLFFVARSLLLI